MNTSIKTCKQCLIKQGVLLLDNFFPVHIDSIKDKTRISAVTLDENGICQYCFFFNQGFNREYIRNELIDFIKSPNTSQYQALVAVSGGKDSLTALYMASAVLDMKVIAFTYDNGFIPDKVIEQSKLICQKLDVPFLVVRKDLYNELQNEYTINAQGEREARTGIDFCQICSKQINKVVAKLAKEYSINKVIYGNKFYAELYPKVSSIKKIFKDNMEIKNINLLFALGMKYSQQKQVLKKIEWEDPKLPGYTSNCLIPGFVTNMREKKLGFSNDAGYVELELRSGMYEMSEAKAIIESDEIIYNQLEMENFIQEYILKK